MTRVAGMWHRRLNPGHPLHPYVYAIWRMDGTVPGRRETVLPHGNIDLLFNLDGPIGVAGPSGIAPILQHGAWVAGLQTRAVETTSNGRVVLLGVSLRAECASAVLPLPASELTDATVDASMLLRDAPALHATLREAPSFAAQCGIIVAWLTRVIAPHRRMRLVDQASALLTRDESEAAVAGAARALGISTRHLRRVFLDAVGVAPAEYVRLARFGRAVGMLRAGGSLTEIAQAAQYYDHAHFCRDFKAIAGMTPSAYRVQAHTGPVAELLIAECPSHTRQVASALVPSS